MRLGTILAFLILYSACTYFEPKEEETKGQMLAQVGENYLFLNEVEDLISISGEIDTSGIINNYIYNWVRHQLVLEKAMEQLPDEINDIEKKVQDYKESLIIFRYEQELIRQKLDTTISEEEIQNYYNEYSSNFILEDDVFNVDFVKLLRSSPSRDSLTHWFKSEKLEDNLKLEEFCNQYAAMFNISSSYWSKADRFISSVNMNGEEILERLNKSVDHFEIEDGDYFLLVNVNGKKLKGSDAPLEYVRNDIKRILLNKRKLSLIDDIHQWILEEGQNKYKVYFDS